MKILWSLSLFFLLLWGTSAAQASHDTLPGVILPAWGDPGAPLTLDVRLEALPPDCVGSTCQLRLYLFLMMTDGQYIRISFYTQRYPRVVGGRAKLTVLYDEDPSDNDSYYEYYKEGRLAPGTPLRIRASARGDTTHLALTWGDKRVVHTVPVPWTRLASVQVRCNFAAPGFAAQIQFPEPPPVIERRYLPAGGYDVVFTDNVLTIREMAP